MARNICVYGGTGTFKTTQVKFFAHYIAKKTGKCTLLLSTDGGGWQPCQPEINAGMIRPFRADTATLPLPILQLVSKGYWPKNPEASSPDDLNFQPVNWDEVGGVALEGWTSISQVFMRFLPDNDINVGGENRKKLGGFAMDVKIGDRTEKLNFYSNTIGDYGFVQNRLYGLVTNFGSLPVDTVLHTALESKAEDDDRATVYGPAIAGKKATAQCGPWVGDLLHAQDQSVPRLVKVPDPKNPKELVDSLVVDLSVRYYFKKHLDPISNIPYPAKTRVPPEMHAELNRLMPGGYFEPSVSGGIDRYLEMVDKLTDSAGQSDALKVWREKQDQKLGRTKVATAPVPVQDPVSK